MDIIKLAELNEEEKIALTTAGKIIGQINKAKEADEIDGIDEASTKLLTAIKDVIEKVLF